MGDAKKSALDLAKRALYAEVARSMADGGGAPLEDDEELNDCNRRVIIAMQEEHGEAWLGFISRDEDDDEDDDLAMEKWDADEILDFGADFVLPRFDAALETMIKVLDVLVNEPDRAAHVRAILARIEAVGGVSLAWG